MKLNKLLSIGILLVLLIIFYFEGQMTGFMDSSLKARPDFHVVKIFITICSLFIGAFLSLYLAKEIKLPSFVVAIIIGILAKPLFLPIIANNDTLAVIISLGASLILFGGGLETEFGNFKKTFWKIFFLAFPGVLLTAILLTNTIQVVSISLGYKISITAAVLLGALLSSTDPAAIIPVLKGLRFKNVLTKDIVVSESAMNDVTGSLLTLVFLSIALTLKTDMGLGEWYSKLFSAEGGIILFEQIAFGIIFGLLGTIALSFVKKIKSIHSTEFVADMVVLLFVPIFVYTLSLYFEGSGFLAAFIAGLIFQMNENLKETELFFNNVVDGFCKPVIFILLGALVNVGELMNYAVVGLIVSFIFMFILRPLMVFLMLGGFMYYGSNKFTVKELLFISFVRETGAIPAVLLVSVSTMGIAGLDGLVSIGMWVILSTLVVQPLLTPWVAKKLKVAEPINRF